MTNALAHSQQAATQDSSTDRKSCDVDMCKLLELWQTVSLHFV